MRCAAAWVFAFVVAACGDDDPPDPPGSVDLVRVWRSDDLPGCGFASPQLLSSQGEEVLVTALSNGDVVAVSPDDGHEVFRVALPAPAGQVAHAAATPGVFGARLV